MFPLSLPHTVLHIEICSESKVRMLFILYRRGFLERGSPKVQAFAWGWMCPVASSSGEEVWTLYAALKLTAYRGKCSLWGGLQSACCGVWLLRCTECLILFLSALTVLPWAQNSSPVATEVSSAQNRLIGFVYRYWTGFYYPNKDDLCINTSLVGVSVGKWPLEYLIQLPSSSALFSL